MIPGEILPEDGEIGLNAGTAKRTLRVDNSGDRPVQVGSHAHFYEVNAALRFDRARAYGFRLDIPAGTALRFEPGEGREVGLTALAGEREAWGMNAKVNGPLADAAPEESA